MGIFIPNYCECFGLIVVPIFIFARLKINRGKQIAAMSFFIMFAVMFSVLFMVGAFTQYERELNEELQSDFSWAESMIVNFPFVYVFLPFAMLAISPLEALTRRLVFLLTGFCVLICLNVLSVYAPDILPLLKPPV
jgi:hypothetical protein